MQNYLKRFISFGLDLILARVVGPGTCKELAKVKSNHITQFCSEHDRWQFQPFADVQDSNKKKQAKNRPGVENQ